MENPICPQCLEQSTGIDSEYKGTTIYTCPNMHRFGFEKENNDVSVLKSA